MGEMQSRIISVECPNCHMRSLYYVVSTQGEAIVASLGNQVCTCTLCANVIAMGKKMAMLYVEMMTKIEQYG